MSNPALHARASELFLTLRELPESERAAALQAAANGDEALINEVTSFLDHDGSEIVRNLGPYRVVARIGQGGSGEVFLAEQEEPIRRRVAIKIVMGAAGSPELAARFEFERRALETTSHPNIARVLDAGRTAEGFPYLVLEHVEGVAITAYCSQRRLPLLERVRLLLQVADAVQHAHQRGVIHRDIKPANILVDADGLARVLDFGIAKPIEGILASAATATLGLPLGTPSYMAPEQTGGMPVDTRADVYALGAVLYELVALRPPIDTSGCDLFEALRRIREVTPPPASRTRPLSELRAEVGFPPRSLLSDLDAILGKALEKLPERRYATAAAFATDVRAALSRQPIEARPSSLAYRAARFVERNRALVATASLGAAALVLGVIGLSVGLLEARTQRREAELQEETQRAINRFLNEDLLSAASTDFGPKDRTVLELLDRASERLEQRFGDRPLVKAALDATLGDAYRVLGEYDRAERHLERSLALRRTAAGVDDPQTIETEIAAATLLVARQRYEEGAVAFTELLPRARLILGPDDQDLYAALEGLGVALCSLGKMEEATALMREALDGRTRLFGPDDRLTLTAICNLAYIEEQTGDTENALKLMEEALRIAELYPGEMDRVALSVHNNLGATLQDHDRHSEAAPHVRKAADLAASLLGPEHPDTLFIRGNLAGLEKELGDPERACEIFRDVIEKGSVAFGESKPEVLVWRHGYWSTVLDSLGRPEEAIEGFQDLYEDALASAKDHFITGMTQASLAQALLQAGQPDEALRHAREAEERLSAIYGPDHHRTQSAARIVAALDAR